MPGTTNPINWLRNRISGIFRSDTYRPDYMVASNQQVWDTEEARLWRYFFQRHWYDNTIYSTQNRYVTRMRKQESLYKLIRPLTNPTKRLVELYVAKTYGGQIDFETGRSGAIPLKGDDALIEPCLQLFRWSNWQTRKSLYPRYGAMLGDTAIRVVDNRASEKVYFEPLDPALLRNVKFDDRGNVDEAWIVVEREEPLDARYPYGTQRRYVFAMQITKDKYRTYKDSEPFAFYADLDGTPMPEWDNEAGFVPIIIRQHHNLGYQWGAAAMHGSSEKIHALNNLTSYMTDQARKDITPLLLARGFDKTPERITLSTALDDINMLTSPNKDASIESVRTQLDLQHSLTLAEFLLSEIERDLPELSLHRLREASNQTAPGIAAAYSDAVERFEEAQGIYDDGMVQALKMGISIGAMNGYKGFEAFTPLDYERGNLDGLFIEKRPVVSDNLTRLEQETLNLQKANFMETAGYFQRTTIAALLDIPGVDDPEAEVTAGEADAEARFEKTMQQETDIQRLAGEPEEEETRQPEPQAA